MKYLLLLCISSTLCFAGQGFFAEENWEARTFPSFSATQEGILVTSGDLQHTFTVSKADTIAKILRSHFGNNGNGWFGKLHEDAAAVAHSKLLKISHFRIPGGNWSNLWLWDHILPQNLIEQYDTLLKSAPTKNWTLTTDELLAVADSIGSTVQPCVNYSLARYLDGTDPVGQAASYAADWVRDLKNRSIEAPYWEVGNENFGPWSAGYIVANDTIKGETFGRDFCIFVDSMKSANAGIKVGVGVLSDDDGEEWTGYGWWMRDMLPEVIEKADYFSIHDYFTWEENPNDITVDSIWAAIDKISSIRNSIDAMVEKYTNKKAGDVPIAMTEFNFRGGQKEVALIAALFHTMALGELIKEQYGLVNVWGLCNNYKESSDHGLLTRRHYERPDYSPNPSFFAYYYMQQFFGDVLLYTTNDISPEGVRAYVSTYRDRGRSLIFVNPTNKAVTVKVDLGEKSSGKLYWYELRGDSLLDKKIVINGMGPTTYTSGGPEVYVSIPAFTAQVDLSDLKITLKPLSAFYGALDFTEAIVQHGDQKEENIFIKNGVLLIPNSLSGLRAELYTMQGRLVDKRKVNTGTLTLSKVYRNIGSGAYVLKLYTNSESLRAIYQIRL